MLRATGHARMVRRCASLLVLRLHNPVARSARALERRYTVRASEPRERATRRAKGAPMLWSPFIARAKRARGKVTMRAWPVARSIFDALLPSPLGCERSERADNRLDKGKRGP